MELDTRVGEVHRPQYGAVETVVKLMAFGNLYGQRPFCVRDRDDVLNTSSYWLVLKRPSLAGYELDEDGERDPNPKPPGPD